jgi:N-acetylneuraminate synthase
MTDYRLVEVIAEVGVNHNGSLERALAMVDAAAEAGATLVKFQTFVPENLVSHQAEMAAYQVRNTGSRQTQLEMLRELHLDEAAHRRLFERCRQVGIGFLSSPFDLESLRFLVDDLNVGCLKIASGEITNAPLLVAAGRSSLPLILSTGMSTIDDVRGALGAVAWGMMRSEDPVDVDAEFPRALEEARGSELLEPRITVLHCTTQYPTPPNAVNLRAMQTLASAIKLPVGFSDHTTSTSIAAAAVALGATVVEKHFTLDRRLPGPDHAASLEPTELAELVRNIREIEQALGDGVKAVQPAERQNVAVTRKSVVAAAPIAAGVRFTEANLAIKRPGTGISPFRYWRLLEREATRDYEPDEAIDEDVR